MNMDMRPTRTGSRTKRNYQIDHNGETYDLGVMILNSAIRRAHVIVRDFLREEWQRTNMNADTTAYIKADGQSLASIYGFHKNMAIHIIHL